MQKKTGHRSRRPPLRDMLARQIETGVLKPGSQLASERELSEDCGMTRVTVREALQQLETEGLVYRMNRRGWFVAARRLDYDPVEDAGFMRNVSRQGRTPKTETLLKEKMPASPWLASHLGVRVGAAVFHLQRRRCIDERPVLLEDIFLIAQRYPSLLTADLDGSLSEVLAQRYGVRTQRSQIVFTSTALLGPHADALLVSPGTPGLLLTRTARDSDGKVVEFDQEYWRHDVLNIALTTGISRK
jgi:Transcriptional regulators|nr:UTRA domain-containing protein [uncultured Steroidobacter sp.]